LRSALGELRVYDRAGDSKRRSCRRRATSKNRKGSFRHLIWRPSTDPAKPQRPDLEATFLERGCSTDAHALNTVPRTFSPTVLPMHVVFHITSSLPALGLRQGKLANSPAGTPPPRYLFPHPEWSSTTRKDKRISTGLTDLTDRRESTKARAQKALRPRQPCLQRLVFGMLARAAQSRSRPGRVFFEISRRNRARQRADRARIMRRNLDIETHFSTTSSTNACY